MICALLLGFLVTPGVADAELVSAHAELAESEVFVGESVALTVRIYAAALPMADFEDAMQVVAARACGARHIVTRNVRDYERSPIRTVGPQEALRGLL